MKKEDIRKLLLSNYEKELVQVNKNIEKNDIKEEKFFNKNKLDPALNFLIHKDYSFIEEEKQKYSFNKEYIKILEKYCKLKIIFDRDNYLCKLKDDLIFKIYKLKQHI